jgi:hypothetical protein
MRLKYEPFDGRSFGYVNVTDEDTGQVVGFIRSNGVGFTNTGGIEISLFDEKYRATLNRREECWGFLKGVEAVLNRMVSADDGRAALRLRIHELEQQQENSQFNLPRRRPA